MADGPDPLGKRALFWMPIEPEAEVAEATGGGPVHPQDPDRHGAVRVRHARPAGKHALYSDAVPAAEPARDRAAATGDDPVPATGSLSVACSTCGSVTRVGVVEFVLLQLPVAAWLPLRTFDRWMTCPACRRRTWTSVTWAR